MKTQLYVLVAMAVCLAASGCRWIGGGIAGARYDPIWQVRDAKLYGEVVASNKVAVAMAPLTGKQPPQLFEGITHAFPVRQERVEGALVSLAGTAFATRYSRNRFELQRDGVTIINAKLPKIFNIHPIRLGMGKLAAQSVVMIVNKTRSSTGLYFVALYTAEGERLYSAVLNAGQVWDIRVSDVTIQILGHSEVRRISMKK